MYKVSKKFKLPSGHRLSKHKGRCFNYHGHNYVIEIQLSVEELNKNDMVIDFHDLKNIANLILDRFDHATVLNSTDKVNIKHLTDQGYRLEFISNEDQDPTAEVFSKYLYEEFVNTFSVHTVDFVRVWESDDSMAEYSA